MTLERKFTYRPITFTNAEIQEIVRQHKEGKIPSKIKIKGKDMMAKTVIEVLEKQGYTAHTKSKK